ncbi:hypothetical protein CFD26_103760 [Aspergillus turcosus]|uniref:NAD-dependent epimerase/dehydratase domain-containing protein n=1 Tax=Aspergillus turcosus TaxID=1245748 RepID=A0A421D1T8_9EURO|nr:hypothetical protein CFD26_103760 [Aspergillus turcosus]
MSSYDVLVTGSAGHLGTALMLSLPSLGFRPFGIDILPSSTTTSVGSITDRAFIASILKTQPIKHVLHAATLHKPHICSHANEDFISTNILGTLVLLEESANYSQRIESFIFFSTTSTFGMALSPKPGLPAAWIDETIVPEPKNIYGVTKVAAEDLCALIQKQSGMPVLVLRTSRFFPEEDDDEGRRAAMDDGNLKVLELAYRRCDIEDIVRAAVCAMQKARDIRWGKYIISAPPLFKNEANTLDRLSRNPAEVFNEMCPRLGAVFEKKGWKHLPRIDRVYDSSKALRELGWEPRYTFEKTVERLAMGGEWRSELTAKNPGAYLPVSNGSFSMPNISLSRAISPKGRVRFRPRSNAIQALPLNSPRIGAQSNGWPRGFRTGQMRNIPVQETTKDDAQIPQSTSEKEATSTRPVVVDSKGKKYYSLKDYREGPNPESGPLDKDYDSEGVRTHNRDVDDRHKKD